MLSIADIISRKKFIKEESTTYVTKNFKNSARIYTVIHDVLQEKFNGFEFKFFVKSSSETLVTILFQSPNNSLIASLNLDKSGLISLVQKALLTENLITEETDIRITPRLC
jgi:hypothetical protein